MPGQIGRSRHPRRPSDESAKRAACGNPIGGWRRAGLAGRLGRHTELAYTQQKQGQASAKSGAALSPILPPPDAPFEGVIGRTYKDSTPSKIPVVKAPEGRAERARRPDRRLRLRPVGDLRRASSYAQPGQARQERPEIHPLPYDRALLSNPGGLAHGSQPPLRGHRLHHRTWQQLSRLHRAGAEELCDGLGDRTSERLQHRVLRQEPQHRRLGDQHLRPIRPLAEPAGL